MGQFAAHCYTAALIAWMIRMARNEILERLRINPRQITMGQLIQDRKAAVHEIERLLLKIDRMVDANVTPTSECSTTTRRFISAKDSKQELFQNRALLRVADVCRLLEISRAGFYKLLADGIFPKPLRIGRRSVRWPVDVIETWLDAQATAIRA